VQRSLSWNLRTECSLFGQQPHSHVQLSIRNAGRSIYILQACTRYFFLKTQYLQWINFKITLSAPVVTQPCQPSPCGPNSQCREINDQAVCSCVPGFIGSPPSCRPECITSSECGQNEACVNQKCRDPCPGTCGVGAKCNVINHNPICSCPPRYTGDPFSRCYPERKLALKFLFISQTKF
jgi:hypothetical protein